MSSNAKPNTARPWLKYYDPQMLANLTVPECTLYQYLRDQMPGEDVTAIDFYGTEISWRSFYANVHAAARALWAAGFREGDQVPVFIKSIPEFFFLLLGCERIGASLMIRDNEMDENAASLRSSGAETMFANDCLSQEEMEYYRAHSNVKRFVLIALDNACDRRDMPDYIQTALDAFYDHECAHGEGVMDWNDFLAMGEGLSDEVICAPVSVNRPLFRAYTSGSTGPSKQVIHSAHSIIGALAQMNFYGSVPGFRPTWLVAVLPPCLVSVTISFLLLPLASNKLLLLDPFCEPRDIDLEFMRLRPNCWPSIPMLCDLLSSSPRIPADYDCSHLLSCGAGCEHMNNTQLHHFQQFLNDHNCQTRFTTGYGSSEAGSNVGFHLTAHPLGNGNVGVPMPLTNVAICTPGTTEELGFNETGEICLQSPNLMLGYDDPAATAKALRRHDDGKLWLHTGDTGYMIEDGVLYTSSRGSSQAYGGGFLEILPMENAVADAHIEGIVDQFFANVPDTDHDGCYLPYLFVVLRDGWTVEDIRQRVSAVLEPHQIPAAIVALPERPYWHFKTHRIAMIRQILGQTVTSSTTAYPSNMA